MELINGIKFLKNHKVMLLDKDSLILKKFPAKLISVGIIFLIMFNTLLSIISYNKGMNTGEKRKEKELIKKFTSSEKTIIIEDSDEFSIEKFVEMLINLNVKFPHIVMAQAYIESGIGTSRLFKTNKNLFGMKEAMVRPNAHSGSEHGHAFYNHWRESVYDYVLWQAYTGASRLRTDDEYYNFLQNSGYAEAEHYIETLRNTIKNKNYKEYFK